MRELGNREMMLEACYQRPSLTTNMLGLLFAFAEPVPEYQQAKLNSTDPAKVPTIPEPETWLLIIVVLLILTWVFGRKRTLLR